MNVKVALAAVVLLFCIVFPQSEAQIEEYPIVNTPNGPVRGRRQYTLFDRNPYYSYKGIPFAKPPVGALRFKPPQPADPWEGIFDASTFGNICIQDSLEGSEDCLTLNVFVPAYTPRVDLPVLVGIYGGAFSSGMSETLGPDFLFDQDSLILVTMNYRLGPVGFLSLNTSEYSGNMGLKDQLLAIKWVNDNIRNFGGDTDRITLYGISAGATSAHHHVLSPASRGLFQRAILASGSAITQSAITRADHLPTLLNYAERNGNPVQNVEQLIEYLQVLNVYDLVNQTLVPIIQIASGRLSVDIFWGPRVETADAIEPFILDTPANILENNFTSNVDTLFGYVSAESYVFINDELINPSLLEPFDEIFQLDLPLYSLNVDVDFESEQFRETQTAIRNFYFGHNEGRVNGTTLFEYSQLVSDLYFVYGIDQTVKIHAASSNGRTFYYRFDAVGLWNVFRWLTAANILGLPGATHGDDVLYAFFADVALTDLYNMLPANSMERRVLNEYSRFYTNFIAYGSPTLEGNPVQLEQVRTDEINFADFTNEGIIVGRDPYASHILFWDELISQHFA